MAESVQTGGVMQFNYPRGEERKISSEQKQAIDEAYEDYYERREKEKKRRRLLILLLLLLGAVLLAFLIYFIFLRK